MTAVSAFAAELARATQIDPARAVGVRANRRLRTVTAPAAVCDLDGISCTIHPVCAGCGVLIGPRHSTTELFAAPDGLRCAGCNRPVFLERLRRVIGT